MGNVWVHRPHSQSPTQKSATSATGDLHASPARTRATISRFLDGAFPLCASGRPKEPPLHAQTSNPPRRRLARALIVVGLGLIAAVALAASAQRLALWQVVRACVANTELTGQAFPCLKVEIGAGVERGWAALRPPLGNPDTILTPTRQVFGLEDSWLRGDDAPNYFAAAWAQRGLVKTRDGRPPSAEWVALSVNSRAVRTQDQLHIHIGCLKPRWRGLLRAVGAQSPRDTWSHVGALANRPDYRAMRVVGADLVGINPFRLAAEAYAHEGVDPADQLILVIPLGERPDAGEFLILTGRSAADQLREAPGAEDFIDPACRT